MHKNIDYKYSFYVHLDIYSLSCLLTALIFLFLFDDCWGHYDFFGLQFLKLLLLGLKQTLVPNKHAIELVLCDKDRVKLFEGFAFRIHDAQTIKSITFDLSN